MIISARLLLCFTIVTLMESVLTQILHSQGSGTQAWVGENMWPVGSKVGSEESKMVSEDERGAEMQADQINQSVYSLE